MSKRSAFGSVGWSTTGLFDRWSATYDDPVLQHTTYRPVHDAVLCRARLRRPRAVLDLGCGTGQLTQRLVDEFPRAHVVGLDRSAGMIERTRTRLDATSGRGVSLVLADAGALPFAPASFDVVVCTESFHWYPDQEDVVRQIATLLRPHGRLLVASVATVTSAGERAVRAASTAAGATIRARPPRQLRRLVERGGLRVRYQRRVARLSPIGWPVLTEAERTT